MRDPRETDTNRNAGPRSAAGSDADGINVGEREEKRIMQKEPQGGEIYRHFKNRLYRVITVATHSETGERLVIYQAQDGNGEVYARPLAMFLSRVDREKYPDAAQSCRFERVEEPGAERTGTQDGAVNPKLMAFLDADDLEERYQILLSMRDEVNDHLINNMAVVMDVVIPEGEIGDRYEQLKNCIRTADRNEAVRLR